MALLDEALAADADAVAKERERCKAEAFQGSTSIVQEKTREYFNTPEVELWELQVDESTNISGKPQLLAFIRFIKNENF